MKKYYYVLPLFYTIAVLILLMNYIFDSKKTSFTWGLMSIQISATNPEKAKLIRESNILPLENTEISNAKIILPQASFTFNSYTSISTNRDNGILTSIAALPTGDGFVLSFGEKTFVSFQTNLLNPEEISIIIYAQPQENIQLLMSLPFGTNTVYKENSLEISRGNATSSAIASSKADFIQSKKSWILTSRSSYASFHFSSISTNTPPTITKVPTLSPNTIAEAKLRISEYIDNAYASWTSKRFNTALGIWEHPEGFFGFSESILASTYAEALYRKQLPQLKIVLDKSSILNKQALSWRSASFAYNGSKLISSLHKEMIDTQEYVLSEIKVNNRSILHDITLWDLIPFWNNSTIQKELLSFIKQTQPLNHSPETSAMLLYQSTISPWAKFNDYVNTNKQLFEQNLINHTAVANEGYMLLDSRNTLDVFYSIVAGHYLMSQGSQDSLKLLGARMLITALSLADEHGYLPRMFVYKNFEYVSIGTISPESIYSIISDNPYFPRIQASNIDNVFYLSNSQLSMVKEQNTLTITVDNSAVNSTQYIYCWRIANPSRITAFEIYWNGNKFPESLSQGVSYDKTNELLTIKMLGRKQKETISVFF